MVGIHLFGGSSPVGISFCEKVNKEFRNDFNIYKYSRNSKDKFLFDLLKKDSKLVGNSKNSIIISFAPIWDLAFFLENIIKNDANSIKQFNTIIAISSTSVLTKRYAFNNFDKNLVSKLNNAEEKLISISKKNKIKLKIIRPTMIYGKIKNKSDKNISKILKYMRFLPYIILPKNTGLRQPIHIGQLADVTLKVAKDFLNLEYDESYQSLTLNVGGDDEISYLEMLLLMKKSLPKNDFARKCRIIRLPDTIFYILAFPIIFINTRYFEAILRIKSNMNGFSPSHKITNTKIKSFPLKINY